MRNLQFTQVVDTGEESLWLRRHGQDVLNTILIIKYFDNFQISGRRQYAVRCHQELMKHFNFSPESNFALTDTLGIERETCILDDGRPAVFIHQTSYAEHVVEEYQIKHYQNKELPGVSTPFAVHEEKEEENVAMKGVPNLTPSDASSIGGAINWAARGSRFDLLLPGKRTIQCVHCWQNQEKCMLHRFLRYWKFSKDVGLICYGDPADRDKWIILMEVDSDHGNDTISGKSTTCVLTWISGPNTYVPLSQSVKSTPNTGRSTAEVEAVAIDRGTFVHAIPAASTLEFILGRPVRIVARSDNDAAIAAAKAGYSRKLSYVRKHQKISLSALREVYVGREEHEEGAASINTLGPISTIKNRSDMGTKPLDHNRHWTLMEMAKMFWLSDIRKMTARNRGKKDPR